MFCVIMVETRFGGEGVIRWESGVGMNKTDKEVGRETDTKIKENEKKKWTKQEVKTEVLSWIKLIAIIFSVLFCCVNM